MKKVKNIFFECLGIWFFRAFIMMILIAIPTYINSLSENNGNTVDLANSMLNDYSTICSSISIIISIIVVWTFFKGKKIKKLTELIKSINLGGKQVVGIALSIVIWLSSLGIIVFLSGVAIKLNAFSINSLLNLIYLFLIILISIISEELFFRVYIINRLNIKDRPIFVVLISCWINLMFLLVHMINNKISMLSWINSFLIMFLCGLLYTTYHNLLLTVGFRTIWTFLSVALLNVQFLNLDRKESMVNIMNDNSIRYTLKGFGATNNIGITLILVMVILLLYFLKMIRASGR